MTTSTCKKHLAILEAEPGCTPLSCQWTSGIVNGWLRRATLICAWACFPPGAGQLLGDVAICLLQDCQPWIANSSRIQWLTDLSSNATPPADQGLVRRLILYPMLINEPAVYSWQLRQITQKSGWLFATSLAAMVRHDLSPDWSDHSLASSR